jgi:DNA (cytosine-5)-methyltransferase 1
LKINTANATGYMEGDDGDGIVLNYLGRARGTVRYGQSPTIQCDGGGPSGVITMDENKLTIRKLTETECLRLMGFNDEEINRLKEAKDDRGKPMFSRTLLYQFAGNSVVVDCYKAIQEVILDDMENEGKPRPGTLEAWI